MFEQNEALMSYAFVEAILLALQKQKKASR